MNYDRIILELLDRVGKLEEEVKVLKTHNKTIPGELSLGDKPLSDTERAVLVIENAINKAKEEGKEFIDVVSLDVQYAVGLKNRLPLCCNAMRKVASRYKSEILYETPSHNSSTYKMRYWVDEDEHN